MIGADVLVGHGALIHGCQLCDHSFVGMRAVVLNKCVVETGALVAAGALVTEGTRVPAGEIWGGNPARKIGLLHEKAARAMRSAVRKLHRSGEAARDREPLDLAAPRRPLPHPSPEKKLVIPVPPSQHTARPTDPCGGDARRDRGRGGRAKGVLGRSHRPSQSIANGLRRLGLAQGDRVALLFDNSPELLELILGTMISGGVVVPLSGLMTDDVVRRMITASGARFAFIQDPICAAFRFGRDKPPSRALLHVRVDHRAGPITRVGSRLNRRSRRVWSIRRTPRSASSTRPGRPACQRAWSTATSRGFSTRLCSARCSGSTEAPSRSWPRRCITTVLGRRCCQRCMQAERS